MIFLATYSVYSFVSNLSKISRIFTTCMVAGVGNKTDNSKTIDYCSGGFAILLFLPAAE